MTYYASFVPGMQELAAQTLKERLSDLYIRKLLDGAVIFETDCTYDKLNFFCFNNIFALIDILETEARAEIHIKKIAEGKGRALPQKALETIGGNSGKIKSFRLVCSSENKPVPVDENQKRRIENFIALNSGLELNRAKPDTEFWFLRRREGFSCFMKRLTNNGPGDKKPRAGELSPELAWFLCRAAGLKHGETAIDPFCGYGSIPEAGCKHFPVKKFYASDIESGCIKTAKEKRALKSPRAEIRIANISSVPDFIQESEIDAAVTDPPWGMYKETALPLQALYDEMLAVFSGLIKSGGRAVILTAAKNELETAAKKTETFSIDKITPVLVSGKKASVYLLKKREAI